MDVNKVQILEQIKIMLKGIQMATKKQLNDVDKHKALISGIYEMLYLVIDSVFPSEMTSREIKEKYQNLGGGLYL